MRNHSGAAPRRAVLIVENLPVPLDRRVWQEALALRAAGWSVTVISPRGGATMRAHREMLEGIEILRYPLRPARRLAGYPAEYLTAVAFSLAWLLHVRLRGHIDVIHACNPPDLFWLLGRLGRLWGSRFIYDQHDVNPELFDTKFGRRGALGRLLRRLTRWLEQRSYDSADMVIVPNESYARIASERGAVPDEKVVIVRNAPNLAEYVALGRGITPDPHRVGYVGVMNEQDGIDTLLRAWKLVLTAADMSDARLELVGDGEARPGLEALAARLGIGHSVVFHGYQRPQQFVPLLARCVACVSPDPPTPFNQVSTMVKVVDYLAIQRPVVGFDLTESRITAGDAFHVASPPDAEGMARTLLNVMRTPSEEQSGSSARDQIDRLGLDWKVSAQRLVHAYDRVTATAGSSGRRPTPR